MISSRFFVICNCQLLILGCYDCMLISIFSAIFRYRLILISYMEDTLKISIIGEGCPSLNILNEIRGSAMGGLGGYSPPSEGGKQFFRRFLAFIVP